MIINEKKDGGTWKRSSLEKQFEALWLRLYPNIDLIAEQTLIPGRKFRTDYLHTSTKTTIELNGGVFLRRSGHKGKASIKDYEKALLLGELGYVTFNLGTDMITPDYLKKLVNIIHMRSI